jgi:cell division protein FtsQ
MRNGVRLLLATAFLGGGILTAQHVPEALASMELFRVDRIQLEGARYLGLDEAVARAGIPEGFSVWDDLDGVSERLATHPLVVDVRVGRRLPSTLVLRLREREPLALVPTPGLVPVDAEGRFLPIDPVQHVLDLPLLRPTLEGEGRALSPGELRTLVGEVARIAALEPVLAASISEASLDAWGDAVVHLVEPRTALQYRPPLTPDRLEEAYRVLADAMQRRPGEIPAVIDLRFADQVVVRYSPRNPR